jgi:hypothetical protein
VNIRLIGDPGVAKIQFLKHITSVLPLDVVLLVSPHYHQCSRNSTTMLTKLRAKSSADIYHLRFRQRL